MNARPAHPRGFTMIELILVLIIISITLLLATPTLRGWGQGQKLRNASDQFLAATGYARSQAVANAGVYAVEINASENTYVVQTVGQDQKRKPVEGDLGRPTVLPTSFTIQIISGGDLGPKTGGGSVGVTGATAAPTAGTALLFYPDARSTPGVVEIKSPGGEVARISSSSPATPFKKVDVTP